jgi:hypothetical protein
MTNYAIKFQKGVDNYLALASEVVDPQYQTLWLNLARECLRLAVDVRDIRS